LCLINQQGASMNKPQLESPNKIIRIAGVQSIFGLGKSSIHDRINRGLLPKPINLGGRAVGYVFNECDTVLKAMIRGDSEANIKALVIELTEQRKAIF